MQGCKYIYNACMIIDCGWRDNQLLWLWEYWEFWLWKLSGGIWFPKGLPPLGNYPELQSLLCMTLVVKTSSYHLYSPRVLHLRLLSCSYILAMILLGFPMKCFMIVQIRVLTPSGILTPDLELTPLLVSEPSLARSVVSYFVYQQVGRHCRHSYPDNIGIFLAL